jgi:outer membrane biosynthesis protein TonB
MLPLLVVLFLISYSLLTMLVVEQGRTIDSQRSLIHLLFGDSIRLSATRVAGHQNQAQQKSNPEENSTQTQGQSPSSQVTQGQAPSVQVPQNPSKPQANVQPGRGSRKAHKAVPPPEMTDPSDMRRVSFSI